MTQPAPNSVRIAIACGGTGGHLFPGLAVAERLVERGCGVTLLISPKEVDQQAVRSQVLSLESRVLSREGGSSAAASRFDDSRTWTQGSRLIEIVTLPAVGLRRGGEIAFVRGFSRSYRAAKRCFNPRPPQAALAMGGFTSAPPILAAKRLGAQTFLHESNTIPGRANRWLSWVVDRAFIGFPCAAARLHNRSVTVTATPVRPQFYSLESRVLSVEAGVHGLKIQDPRLTTQHACRATLGLEPDRPVLLVVGGSQGASGINNLVIESLPLLARRAPQWQWFHLTGSGDMEKARQAYAGLGIKAIVHGFFAEMELALGAASAAISRAGASSLAELAAMRVPAVLVPYPAATGNHQLHNAAAYAKTGAARLLEQKSAGPQALADMLVELVENSALRETVQNALAQWHRPHAAEHIAQAMLQAVHGRAEATSTFGTPLPAKAVTPNL
jgi:UDP-N-acetylglucosamine--N-acetylmuramyl-(pentapeptide) pyrophosphoryl-undecaprenol N-acetylglucosamine transferase